MTAENLADSAHIVKMVRSVQPNLGTDCPAWRKQIEECRYWMEVSEKIPAWRPIDTAPYDEWVLAWLYLPKNPKASAPVVAQRVFAEEDEPERYGEFRRTIGCWWAGSRYYEAGHVQCWMPLPLAPDPAILPPCTPKGVSDECDSAN